MMCNDGLIRDNYFEYIVRGLVDYKMVIVEQVPDKHNSVDTIVKVLNPSNPDDFLEDPLIFFESPLLLYTIFQLEIKFGRRWMWIDTLLRNNPLFRGYKLTQRFTVKLAIYLHLLAGDRLFLNYKQSLPAERIANLAFFPTDQIPQKKSSVGRKKKPRSQEKDEENYKAFVQRFEAQRAKLGFTVIESEEERIGSTFFNKMKFFVQEKKNRGFHRFKKADYPKTPSKRSDQEPEQFPDKIPIEKREKRGMGLANYARHLKRQHREEFEKSPIILEIERQRKLTANNARPGGMR